MQGERESSALQLCQILVEVERSVPADGWDAFLACQKELLMLVSKEPGFVWASQLRAREEDVALDLLRFRSRDDYVSLVEGAAYRELIGTLPGDVAHTRTQCFEVISDVGPKGS